jgi:hypothetical protein
MNVLLQAKADVEKFFGKKATMATNILGMVDQGEKAYGWISGEMELTVGFFKDKARYITFKKRTGTKWDEANVRACLMTIGDFSNWTSKPASEYFDYVEREGGKPEGKIFASATGWHSPKRRYAFVYVPTAAGEIAIIPIKDSIDKKFPGLG